METISLQLTDYGFEQFNPQKFPLLHSPSFILLNTCVVTQKAEKETRQKIRELRKKFPDSFLVVLGCAVTAKEKFNIFLPEADLLISNEEKYGAVEYIRSKLLFEQCREQSKECFSTSLRSARRISILNKYILSGRKFIKIQEGCNNFCSYCITTHLRGKSTSVPIEKIVEEINFWVEKGIKEVILTGINIGMYGKDNKITDRYDTCHITSLLNRILLKIKIERISFSSIYPEMLTDDFLKLVVGNPRITQCFHLSLQSGSQSVLERMNRKTDLEKLAEKMSWIKKQNPFFTFRADIITGFPGETEKEFQETLDFIKKAKISFVHSFLFSRRPFTKSEGFIKSEKWHNLPIEIKKERQKILLDEVEEIRNEEAERMVGVIFDCLIVRLLSCLPSEALAKLGYLAEGITKNGVRVRARVREEENLKGKILAVKITGFEENYLLGEIMSLPTN